MLKSMRDSIRSWTIKVLLAFIVLSFISFYGWRNSQERNASAIAAVVDGEPISTNDVNLSTQNVIDQYRRLGILKEQPSEVILTMLRNNVLQSLIDEKVKTQEARRFGL